MLFIFSRCPFVLLLYKKGFIGNLAGRRVSPYCTLFRGASSYICTAGFCAVPARMGRFVYGGREFHLLACQSLSSILLNTLGRKSERCPGGGNTKSLLFAEQFLALLAGFAVIPEYYEWQAVYISTLDMALPALARLALPIKTNMTTRCWAENPSCIKLLTSFMIPSITRLKGALAPPLALILCQVHLVGNPPGHCCNRCLTGVGCNGGLVSPPPCGQARYARSRARAQPREALILCAHPAPTTNCRHKHAENNAVILKREKKKRGIGLPSFSAGEAR